MSGRLPFGVKLLIGVAAAFCLGMAAFIAGVIFSMAGDRFSASLMPIAAAALIVLTELLVFAKRKLRIVKALTAVIITAALALLGNGLYRSWLL